MSTFTEVINYAYPNARIKAMQSFLIPEKLLRAMTEARSVENLISHFEQTSYRDEFRELESIDSITIERALLKNLVSTYEKMLKISPEKAIPVLNCISREYEIMLIKDILTAKIESDVDENELKERSFMLSDKIKVILPRIIEARSIEETINSFNRTEYRDVLKRGYESYLETNNTMSFSIALDEYYFSQLWRSTKNIKDRDGEITHKFIGIQCDVINIMTLLRSKFQKFDVKKFIIPLDYNLKHYIDPCIKAENITEIVSILGKTPYGKIISDSITEADKKNPLLKVELNLKRYIAKVAKSYLVGYPFHIGTILGFLRLKEIEIKNLRAITVCIENELNPDEIRDMLV